MDRDVGISLASALEDLIPLVKPQNKQEEVVLLNAKAQLQQAAEMARISNGLNLPPSVDLFTKLDELEHGEKK